MLAACSDSAPPGPRVGSKPLSVSAALTTRLEILCRSPECGGVWSAELTRGPDPHAPTLRWLLGADAVDANWLEHLLDSLSELQVREVRPASTPLASLGLEAPEITLRVTSNAGTAEIALGARTGRNLGPRFAKVSGTASLVAVDGVALKLLARMSTRESILYRRLSVWDADDVDTVELLAPGRSQGRGARVAFGAERDGHGWKPLRGAATGPSGEAAAARVSEWLEELSRAEAEDFAPAAPRESLTRRTLRLTHRSGEVQQLLWDERTSVAVSSLRPGVALKMPARVSRYFEAP